MTALKQLLVKQASVLLLLLGVLMLGVSISNSALADTPACDGVSCANGQPCGTKCVCNSNGPICLDNTPLQQ
jgi:hypothetical protein